MNANSSGSSVAAESPAETHGLDSEAEITLGVLNAVERSDRVTQRSVAGELGIALGLANAYLKRCVKKGYIKVTQAPANRYFYYLTPTGFAEKSRLTARYLSISFNFFRAARRQLAELVEQCVAQGWARIALAGNGDLVEIASLCIGDRPVTIMGVIDPHRPAALLEADLRALGTVDAVIITDIGDPQATFNVLAERMPADRILAPRFLNISRHQASLVE